MSSPRSIAAAVTTAVTVAVSYSVHASDPGPALRQFAHTAWRAGDGFANGARVLAIAQGPDGYLWLGTELGMLRFDGVRTIPWQAPAGQSLPSNEVRRLLAAGDGTLWIGTPAGLASLKNGTLTRHPELDGYDPYNLVEDRDQGIWVVGWGRRFNILCSFRDGRAACHGADGSLGRVRHPFVDRTGAVWVGAAQGLWRWRPGVPTFYPASGRENSSVSPLAQDDDGTLLVSFDYEIRRFIDGRMETFSPARGMPRFQSGRALRDRNGGLWIAAAGLGLVRVDRGKVEWFTRPDGLSGNGVEGLIEDREGHVWTATAAGIDRFRARAAAQIVPGRDGAVVESILALKDGTVWLATRAGLARWRDDELTALAGRDVPLSLRQDSQGRIWVATRTGVGYIDDDRFIPLHSVPRGWVHAIATSAQGDLWVLHHEAGLLRVRDDTRIALIPWSGLGRSDVPIAATVDSTGGLWLGYGQRGDDEGGVIQLANGKVQAAYRDVDGLGRGRVHELRVDREDTVWAATEGGLSRLRGGRVATLTAKHGLPCDAVYWMMEDPSGSVWLYLRCGIVRLARAEMDAVLTAIDRDRQTARRVRATLFDSADGVSTDFAGGEFRPRVSQGGDGRLWFSPAHGLNVIDPRRIPFNALPPPVRVEYVTADHQRHDAVDGLRLPPLVRDLQIDYTALSFGVPEKVQFRYKLEGHDREWQEVGRRRQAFYSNLGPGRYRFRVGASNNSGVWNETGAAIAFDIEPAYHQAVWFRIVVAAASGALLVVLYRVRARRLTRQLKLRFEERLAERTRVARDLHDTLLQTIQGSKLVADRALRHPEDSARHSMALGQVAQWLDRAVREGRDALHSLRTPAEPLDLVDGLREVVRLHCEPVSLAATVDAVGQVRAVAPLVGDHVYRIGEEAIRNACAHASAASLSVEVRFGRDLILSVIDDGSGIEHDVATRGRDGHFGVTGMHERAAQIGAALTIRSTATGTRVTLIVPGHVAFARAGSVRR